MRAAMAVAVHPEQPLAGLLVGDYEQPTPGLEGAEAAGGFVAVDVRAAAINHHDLWSLKGYGLSGDRLPMVLGTDAAGTTTDGRHVIVHAVIDSPSSGGTASLLSERLPGTLAERVLVPAANLVPKPPELSFEEAACLPTSYLTAYNMLFGKARLLPGEHVLIQGAGGGVATAAIALATAAGLEVTVCSRNPERAHRAQELGADHIAETGERLPTRVDAVLETVGAATFSHSLRSVRPGGRIVVAGATSGFDPPAELQMLFMRDVSVIGTYMGGRAQLELLARFLVTTGLRPLIDSVSGLDGTPAAMARLEAGTAFGKLVIDPTR